MRVFEVMTANVETVPPSMPAADAWELMRRDRIHHLVVTKGAGAAGIVGILSDRDTGGKLGARARVGRTVAELMSSPVATVGRTDTLRVVAKLMRGRSIGCVPVVEGKKVIGIVTVSDLLEALGRGIDRPVSGERRMATHRVPHRKIRRAPMAW
jgi:acetoin utilization protein AcuB